MPLTTRARQGCSSRSAQDGLYLHQPGVGGPLSSSDCNMNKRGSDVSFSQVQNKAEFAFSLTHAALLPRKQLGDILGGLLPLPHLHLVPRLTRRLLSLRPSQFWSQFAIITIQWKLFPTARPQDPWPSAHLPKYFHTTPFPYLRT